MKLPDPNVLMQNYDFLELVVSDTTDKQLSTIFILETFPFVMFIFKIVSMIHQNEFLMEHKFDFYWLGTITFLYVITFLQAVHDSFHLVGHKKDHSGKGGGIFTFFF